MERLTKLDYLNKKGQYEYIIFTTKNPKTRRDFQKALDRLNKKWKEQKYIIYNKNK